MMRKTLTFLGCGLLLGCGSPSEPDSPPMIEGPIVAMGVVMASVSSPTIHVKEHADEECGIVFGLSDAEIMRRTPGGSVEDADVEDLTVGLRVRVWARIVAESCPGQSSADTVVILG